MIEWTPDGRICPTCQGPGRGSPSYPAALCRECESGLVDWAGCPVRLANTSFLGTGVEVSNGRETIINEDAPLFARGVICWAREARLGGVVVQPVAHWLQPYADSKDPDRLGTLQDFNFDGRAVLAYLVEKSQWVSTHQAIASLSIFAHPDVVAATGQRAVFRTIRGAFERGKIRDGVMMDDNRSPALAFEWSTGFKRNLKSNLTCCHLYAESHNPDAYTDLRNIFYVPSFIAKLTDCQAVSVPIDHALHILRYRAFVLYGYCGPKAKRRPSRPEKYGSLQWGSTFGANTNAENLEQRLRDQLIARPKDRITKSVAKCGWTFSNYRPDPLVVYSDDGAHE